jgi:predicted TIM-barrel fold metal-dependent hydrolase/ketosteroid isomerase-like protein
VSDPCQGPRKIVTGPGFAAPRGACDCHAHIIGPEARFPFVEPRSFTPPDALVPEYRSMLGTLGIERNVVVQPSVYGTDNSRTLRAVIELGPDRARGIASVEESVSLAELRELDAAGFKGARFITMARGGAPIEHLQGVARKIAPLGWHIEMFVPTDAWPELYSRVRDLPTPVVFDHMAHITPDRKAEDPALIAVMKLLETGRCWVKLCGYRVSLAGYPYADVAPVAQRFVRHALERCVWGTDWPHTKVEGHMPDDGELLTLLADWVPEASARDRILVQNPEALYGFETGGHHGEGVASDAQEIVVAERSLYGAMVARDLPALRELLSEDLVYVHSPGFAESKQQYLDAVAEGVYEYARVESRGVDVKIHAGTAVETGRVEMSVGAAGKPKTTIQLLFTLVWVKRGSRWQLAVRQATRLPAQ